MSRRVNFTKAVIEAAKCDENVRLVLMDTTIAGLQCRVSPTGVKTFSLYRRTKGRTPERVTLGRYPDLSIQNARKMAQMINAEIASGANPAQIKRAHKAEHTFKELFDDYIENYAKFKSRTWEKDLGRYQCYLRKPLAHKRHSEISKSDIAAIHSGITKQIAKGKKDINGKPKLKSGATANRILDLISAVFNWGINTGLCETNPAKGIKDNPVKSRDRFLQKDELPKFFEALNRETNSNVRDYVLLSLLNRIRPTNPYCLVELFCRLPKHSVSGI